MINTWDENAEELFLLPIVARILNFFGSSYKMANVARLVT